MARCRSPYVGTKIATYRTVLKTTRTQLRSINERIASADKAIAAGHLNALDKLTLITQLDTALQRQGNLLNQLSSTHSHGSSIVIGALIGLLLGAITAIVVDGRGGRTQPA